MIEALSGRQFVRSFEGRNRFLNITNLLHRYADTVRSRRVTGNQAFDFAIVVERFCGIARVHQDIPQCQPDLWHGGLQPDCLQKDIDRFVKCTGLAERLAEIEQQLRIGGSKTHGPAKTLRRIDKIALHGLHQTEIVPGRGVIGFAGGCSTELGRRVVVLLLCQQHLAEAVSNARIVGLHTCGLFNQRARFAQPAAALLHES